jgi:putative transposase
VEDVPRRQGNSGAAISQYGRLLHTAQYASTLLRPTRVRLVEKPELYPWSSVAAHVKGVDDALVKVAPLLGLVNDWRSLLQSGMTDPEAVLIRRHERTGRPLGEEGFVSRLESMLSRVLHPLKPGRKRKEK